MNRLTAPTNTPLFKGLAPAHLGTQISPARAAAARMVHTGDIRLLVLDDDPAISRLVQAALSAHEFVIDGVSEPKLMVKALEDQVYHLIILDYVLPGLNSSKVLETIRDTQPDASIIVITAFPSIDSALDCLRNHTYDYITKPFPIDQLQKTVLKCLEACGLLRLSEVAMCEQLGASIRERRKALGLTLADMAKRANLSVGFLSQIELGKNSASIETFYRIALALRVRIADLFQAIQAY